MAKSTLSPPIIQDNATRTAVNELYKQVNKILTSMSPNAQKYATDTIEGSVRAIYEGGGKYRIEGRTDNGWASVSAQPESSANLYKNMPRVDASGRLDVKNDIYGQKELKLVSVGDITINADGGQVHIKDGDAPHFDFDCDNTSLTIYDDTVATDRFIITVGQNGATDISTYDTDGNAGHLTINPDGNIKLIIEDGVADALELSIGSVKFGSFWAEEGSHSTLKLYENGGDSTDDYVSLVCTEHGATTLSTVDAAAGSANLTFDIDGVIVMDSLTGTTTFLKNGNSDDFFRITVGDDGDTILSTSDSAAAAANLKLQADGDIELNADGKDVLIADDTTSLAKFSNGAPSSNDFFLYSLATANDYFKIAVSADGVTTLSTTDNDGSDGNLFIKPDGHAYIQSGGVSLRESSAAVADTAGYGQLWIENSAPNELCFTDDAGTDIVGIGKYQYETKFVGYYGNNSSAWLPMNGYIVEGSTSTSRNEYQAFIAPYDGTLVSYYWRSEIAQGGSNHSLRVLEASDGTEIPGTILYRKDYDPGSIADDTTTAWDFSSPSVGSDPVSFTKGRLYQFYVDFAAAPYDTNITLTFKWDITS